MIIKFKATEFGVHEESELISCGASNTESDQEYHYLFVQKLFEQDELEESEIYFEIDDQINGGYEMITNCILNRNLLEIRLNKGCKWYPDLEKIIVILPHSTEEIQEFANGFTKLFCNHEEKFKVDA
ncbi:MAG: hypothetical protein GY786_02980 [Proteobacteria bacterium]|nr:hypothetical protein [Pseudomonadota bacterium]